MIVLDKSSSLERALGRYPFILKPNDAWSGEFLQGLSGRVIVWVRFLMVAATYSRVDFSVHLNSV